jgi:SAM-dependent methyltransferase
MTHPTLTRQAPKHDGTAGLLQRVRAALAALGPEDAPLSVAQLAALDQFHTRGLAATTELAAEAGLAAGMTVLDLGSGLGGPARTFAADWGVRVIGVDRSAPFVETARYLSRRCGLEERTRFELGDAAAPPVDAASVDCAFLLHVAMNVADRAALYGAIHRALRPGGRLVSYDIVARHGELHFPLPWAATPDGSHLLTADATRAALLAAGFRIALWRDDGDAAARWFAAMQAGGPPPAPHLGLVLDAGFPAMVANLARDLREGRAGVLAAIAVR